MAAGLCAGIGHGWSAFLGFTGGRALSSILGTLAVVFPQGALIQLLLMGLGLLFRVEQLTTLGLLALPFWNLACRRSAAVTWGCFAMIALTAVKRLEANRAPLPPGPERWHVAWRRLWLDRDVPPHQLWVTRRPEPVDSGGEASPPAKPGDCSGRYVRR